MSSCLGSSMRYTGIFVPGEGRAGRIIKACPWGSIRNSCEPWTDGPSVMGVLFADMG